MSLQIIKKPLEVQYTEVIDLVSKYLIEISKAYGLQYIQD